METTIELDLTKHCIETEVKRIHNRLIYRYLRQKEPDPDLAHEIQVLEKTLTRLDFAMLRNTFRPLAGDTDQKVVMVVDEKWN